MIKIINKQKINLIQLHSYTHCTNASHPYMNSHKNSIDQYRRMVIVNSTILLMQFHAHTQYLSLWVCYRIGNLSWWGSERDRLFQDNRSDWLVRWQRDVHERNPSIWISHIWTLCFVGCWVWGLCICCFRGATKMKTFWFSIIIIFCGMFFWNCYFKIG